MDPECGFLYGVVALQAGLIDSQQFKAFMEASPQWDTQRDGSMADLLIRRGWIQARDRGTLEHLVQRRLAAHPGDAKAGLASVTQEMEHSLGTLRQASVGQPATASF